MGEQLGVDPQLTISLWQSNQEEIAHLSACSQQPIYQLLGIAYRLVGDYEAAAWAFKQSLMFCDLSEDHSFIKEASILRDFALVYLERSEYQAAESTLLLSLTLIEGSGRDEEYYATKGFLGRHYLAIGNKDKAQALFKECDEWFRVLGSNQNYELNNLAQLLALLPRWQRLKYIPRAWRLIRQTGQTRRYKQALHMEVKRE